jgi:ATP-binding cassette subfamily B protein
LGAAALAVQLQAIFGVLDLSGDDSWMQRGGAAASRVNALETMVRPRPTPTAADFSLSQPPDIHLEAVTFAYPTSDHPVLHNLNLRIPAGTSIALVGLNGAGKTTLIKLLAGLYRPESGRVLINGRDLSSVPLEDWWQTLAVVFQDYVRFELTARENVGFDRDGDEALQRAAQAAALESVISNLPAGWDTTLSRAYTHGSDLSGGEWQRVALARALFAVDRGAKIVVLDEPTARLDVRAEAETFERVLELTKGLTVVLVSHRYSTVRRADLIALLDGGQIVEIGSPSELLARPSRYAAMFRSHRRLAESDE